MTMNKKRPNIKSIGVQNGLFQREGNKWHLGKRNGAQKGMKTSGTENQKAPKDRNLGFKRRCKRNVLKGQQPKCRKVRTPKERKDGRTKKNTRIFSPKGFVKK